MAYSGRLICTDFKDAFSKFVRFICDDPNTPGRDWEIVFTELDTSSGNFEYIQYSGSIDVTQLNVWYYLPTVFVTEYTFSRGGNNLVEGTDYTLDWKLGKVKFHTGSPPYTVNYNYKFKRFRFIVRNTGPGEDDYTWIGFLLLSPGLHRANVLLKCYKHYNPSHVDFFDAGTFGNPRNDLCFGFWDSEIHMWVFSNKFRIIVVARSNIYYSFAYVGRYLPLLLPDELPYPLAVFGDLVTSEWYDSNNSSRHFFITGNRGSVFHWANAWTNSFGLYPTHTAGSQAISYMENFPKVLFPVYIVANNYTCGMFDGAYWSPGLYLSSESTFTIGSDTYIIFQNCWRTGWPDYISIKCE